MKFWNKLLSRLSSLFKNGGTNWSSVRFSFIVTVIISNICFWGIWTGLSIFQNTILTIPESVIVIYCLANGIAVGSKLVQKPMEHKDAI
jgi:hypothetical protein